MQFTTVQASLVRGELDGGLSILSQYNPHGAFIALEDLSYVTMLVSFVFISLMLGSGSRIERVLRVVLAATGTVGVAAFVALVSILGRDLEYWYELAGLSLAWTALIVVGVLTGGLFIRLRKQH
ncbi:MAG TPA: hypothetical protein VFZ85_03245 [Jiangellaceae bacterium]